MSEKDAAAAPGARMLRRPTKAALDHENATKVLVRLHRTLWARTMRSNPALILSAVLIGFYGLLGVASFALIAAASILDVPDSAHVLTAVNAGGVLTYVLLGVMMPAGEKQLSARSLSALPLSLDEVRPALMRSSLLTSRVAIAAGTTIVWAAIGSALLIAGPGLHPGYSVPAFVVGMALSWVITVATSECLVQAASAVSNARERKGKNLQLLVLFVGPIALIFGFIYLSSNWESVPLATIGAVCAWTPLSAATGWATSLAGGNVLAAAAQLAIAVATAGLLLWWWRSFIDREFSGRRRPRRSRAAEPEAAVGPAAGDARARGPHESVSPVLRAFGLAYRSPRAMEYARSVLYVARDTRLAYSILVLPVFGGVAVYQTLTISQSSGVIMLSLLAVLGGIMAVNDYGYDGSAGWVKMAAPVPAAGVFRARHAAHMSAPWVILLVSMAVTVAVSQDHARMVAFMAVPCGVGLSAASISAVLTVFNPYPVSPPGTNPWTDKSAFSGSGFVSAIAGFLLGWIPAAPGIVLLAVGDAIDNAAVLVAGAVVALLIPAIVYAFALWACGKRANERMPEIYAKTKKWVQ